MNYIVDTHAFLWSLFHVKRLSAVSADIFRRAEQEIDDLYIPAVVVAEMIMVVEKKRIDATMPQLLAAFATMHTKRNYHFLTLSPDLVIASHTLTAIPDIFDRLIVAEARRLNLPLITRDTIIVATGLVPTVWD